MDGFFWPLLLIAIGVILLSLELFVPSGGLLGVFAGLAFLTAIVIGFLHNPYTGASSIVLVSIIIPAFLSVFIYYWPKTPIGRRMLLRRDEAESETLLLDEEEELLRTLIGKRGRAKTKMLPSGAVVVDGQTFDAATDGIAVEAGQPVEVIALRFKRLVVRPIENDASPASNFADPLSQPIEQFGLGNFEDPLL